MILKPNGRPATPQITKQYDPRLARLLMELEQVLREQGIGLCCMKCERLGLKDGMRGESTNSEYVLVCGCSRRSFVVATGQGTVRMQ